MCAAALLAIVPTAQATTYRGQWQCSDRGAVRPIAGADVELWSRGFQWLPVELVGRRVAQGRTADDGSFSLDAPSEPEGYYARLSLHDARGLHVRYIAGFADLTQDSAVLRNDVATRDLGGIMSGASSATSPPCALYGAFHDTWSEYLAAVGSAPPFPALSINAGAPFIGVPFTAPGSIQWPSAYNVGSTPGAPTVPAHEFAHAFRFDFDGDYAHFLVDVVGYAYPQNHSICDRKNAGFAFNEGWAEYWSRQVVGQPNCPGAATDDYQVEGRVAAALADLEARCAGGSRGTMVEVLRANRGTIHSFAAFRDRLPCPAPASPPAMPPGTGEWEPAVAPSAAVAAIKQQLGALRKDISALKHKLPAAVRAAKHAPPCVRVPCLRALAALTRAPGLKGEMELLRIRRASLRGLLAPAAKRKLRSRNPRKISRDLAVRSRRLSRALARSAHKALRAILRAARPVLRHDLSSPTRFFADLEKSLLAETRKAAHGAALPPPGFAGIPDGTKPPKRVPVRSFPPPIPGAPAAPTPTPTPAPTPSADTRADTTLTVACPKSVTSGKPIDISGNLSPAVGGATVHVAYSGPKGEQTPHDATTNADGSYADSFTPTTSGAYSVQAAWDGDGAYKPSSSPACMTTVS